MRFELVDRVTDVQDDSLTAVKNVTLAEEYLQDHFPSFPVLPGVMMLEAMVQAAQHWIKHHDESLTLPFVVSDVRNIRYGNMVRPGQTLTVTVNCRKREDNAFSFEGTGTVGEQIAVSGRFTLVPVDHYD